MDSGAGVVFQIQRWSVHDGEGIRSTVFLKGCPLRCKWCANPESWNSSPEVLYNRERCSGCGRCVRACVSGAIIMTDGTLPDFARASCSGCGKCCEACLAGARTKIGSVVTVEDVMQVIKRDAVFYRASGGGVTFSGGEPFAQPEFLRQLVAACTRLGLDTAVETSGFFDWEQVQDIFEGLDAVFVDIKHMDDKIHKKMTGASNQRILANITSISQRHPKTIVRVPLIPQVNGGEENVRRMCEFLRQNTRVEGIELLPYHDFGASKYSAAGIACPTFQAPEPSEMEDVKRIIQEYGISVLDFK
ncbi:MAG: glycyl-radical enzyme activating protein [Negativicutes bacterium]|nr:glycyl-radical enzyme activating protein [Negativicutes bacterium]